MLRRHGIIGGPKQRPPRPKMLPGFMPKKQKKQKQKELIDVVVVDSVSEEVLDDFDCVEEEDILDEYIPVGVFQTEHKCTLCEFTTKSEKGLKIHMNWHLSTEVSEQE
jgi:hypothetical protein